MISEQKHWNTPELTVLVRSNPEEMVLAACKSQTGYGDPTVGQAGCLTQAPGTDDRGNCGACQSMGGKGS